MLINKLRNVCSAALFGLLIGQALPVQAQSALEGKLIINEWSQQSAGDWVEVLVTETTDLRGVWICDSGGPSASDGLQLSTTNTFWEAVPAGTLIVFHAGNPSLTEDHDASDYKLVFNADTLADASLFDAVNANFKAYGGGSAGDNPRLFDAALELIHDWDQGDDAAFTGTLRASAAGETNVYTSSTPAGVLLAANWTKISSGATPGAPNGGANTTWIESLYTAPAPDPAISVAPGSLSFGPIDAAETSTASLTISNTGATQPLSVTAAAVSGAYAARFSVLTALPLSIGAGLSQPLIVEFAPGGADGTFAAQLDLTSNAAATPLTTVTLTASAVPSGGSPLAGKVIINEWSQQSAGDWVEILVTQAADLRGLWVCDSGGPSASDGLQLSTTNPFWASVPAGTLIVFHAGNPGFVEDHDLSDYKLVFNADNLADASLFDPVNANFKAYGGGSAGDNPRLFDASLELLHDWDQGDDAAFTGTLRASAAGETDVYTSNTATGVSNPANWVKVSSGTTPGEPNGGANTAWITALREELAGKVIINEWSQQSAGDWVEILVTHTADLRGLWICDEGGPDASDGLQLSTTNPFWAAIPAGTLILFHAGNPAFTEDHNAADYRLVFNASSLADASLFDPINDNFKAYGGGTATDNPRLFDKNLVLLHDWDQGNDAAFTGTLRATASGDTNVYNGSNAAGVSDAGNWAKLTSGATPGAPNGGANTTWIESLYTTTTPDPSLSHSPGAIAFGTVDAASTSQRTLNIINLGATQNLTVTAAAITGTDSTRFNVLTGLPLTIAAGSSRTLEIQFTPGGASGSFSAQLNLTSNDAETAVKIVTLTANAVASGGSPLAGKVIINEWQQSADGDWIELLVTETADLRGLWICDSGGPSYSDGLQFSPTNPFWASIPAGTLITVYDGGQPVAQDTDRSDFNLAFVYDAVEAAPYWDSNNFSFKAFGSGNPEDNPRLFDKDLILIHDWDQGNDPAFTGSLRATVPLDTDIYLGASAAGVSVPSNWVMLNEGTTPGSATPGQPNGGANTTWILGLRVQPASVANWAMYQ